MTRKAITDKNRQIVKKTLEALMVFDKVIMEINEDWYGDGNSDNEFDYVADELPNAAGLVDLDLVEWCADMMGVPKDSNPDQIYEDGDDLSYLSMSDREYSRDWLHDAWGEVLAGEHTIDYFIAEMEQDDPLVDEEFEELDEDDE